MSDRDLDEYLAPSEVARDARRDRDLSAEARALMSSTPKKVIKQKMDLILKQVQEGVVKRKRAKPKRKRVH